MRLVRVQPRGYHDARVEAQMSGHRVKLGEETRQKN